MTGGSKSGGYRNCYPRWVRTYVTGNGLISHAQRRVDNLEWETISYWRGSVGTYRYSFGLTAVDSWQVSAGSNFSGGSSGVQCFSGV